MKGAYFKQKLDTYFVKKIPFSFTSRNEKHWKRSGQTDALCHYENSCSRACEHK